MTQQRLNHIAVFHTHQEELDALDTTTILSEFVSASDIRSSIFGPCSVALPAGSRKKEKPLSLQARSLLPAPLYRRLD